MLAIFPSLQPRSCSSSVVTRYADQTGFPHLEEVLEKVFGLYPGEPEAELPVSLRGFLARSDGPGDRRGVRSPPPHQVTVTVAVDSARSMRLMVIRTRFWPTKV